MANIHETKSFTIEILLKKESADDNSVLMKFFTDELKDIYWAEKHLAKDLPKISKAATSEQLKVAFLTHASDT